MWTARMLGFATPVTRAAAPHNSCFAAHAHKKEHSCGEQCEDAADNIPIGRQHEEPLIVIPGQSSPPRPAPLQLVNIKISTCLLPNHYHPNISTVSDSCMLSTYLLAMH